MLNTLDASQEIQSVMALLSTLSSGSAPTEQGRRIAWLEQQARTGRAALQRQVEGFDNIYQEVEESDLNDETIKHLAKAILEEQRTVANKIYPGMEIILREIFTSPESDISSYWYECLKIGIDAIKNFRSLSDRLLRLAEEGRAASGEIMRARPIQGEVDYEALSREHMARYPKIRAALAK